MISIDFEFDAGPYGVFRDALHLPDDQTFTDDQIAEMKQQRYQNWLAIVNPPASDTPPPPEPETPPANINISGVDYTLLEGTPASGAVLIEVNGTWYQKA